MTDASNRSPLTANVGLRGVCLLLPRFLDFVVLHAFVAVRGSLLLLLVLLRGDLVLRFHSSIGSLTFSDFCKTR